MSSRVVVEDGFADFERDLDRGVERALGRATEEMVREARAEAPHKTGRLRRSISADVERTSSGVEGVVSVGVPYGRRQNRRFRFLEEGLERGEDIVLDALRRELPR